MFEDFVVEFVDELKRAGMAVIWEGDDKCAEIEVPGTVMLDKIESVLGIYDSNFLEEIKDGSFTIRKYEVTYNDQTYSIMVGYDQRDQGVQIVAES